MHFKGLGVYQKLFACVLTMGVLVLCAAVINKQPVHAVAGINQQMNFQGRLLNAQGAVVPDGYYNMQFKIYQDGDGQSVGNTTGSPAGSLKWTEDHLNVSGKGIMVKNGFMSVELGSVTPFGSNIDWNQTTLWLSINVGNTNTTCTPFANCSPDGEMVPMKRLTSSPYALNSGLLGGLANSQFIQLAQGVQTDASNNTSSIYLNKTGTGGNFLSLQSNSVDVFNLTSAGDITMGAGANHTIKIADTASGVIGKDLAIYGGSTTNSGTGAAGGNLVLQGGNAGGSGNNNGGNITLAGGNGTGSGSKGLVKLSASAFMTNTNAVCSADCSVDQSNVDNYGAVIISASSAGITITLPTPTNASTAGRIFYVISDNNSENFTLSTNGGEISMRKNVTATMIWNGSYWTAGGVANGALGGLDSSQFVQLAQGVQEDASTNTNSIYINKTGTGGNLMTMQSGGVDVFNLNGTGDIVFGSGANHVIQVAAAPEGVVGKTLYVYGGATANSGTGAAGGNLVLQGGNAAGSGNNNGGNVTIAGGSPTGTGTKGLVNISASAFIANTDVTCSANCVVTQSNVDNFGTVIISASNPNITITLPPPTNTTVAGRILYVTSDGISQDFTLTTNTGGDNINVAMRKNTTATMIWNGTNWTAGGASNATTLQAAYANGSNPSTTPEIKLDTIRGTIDIQDADVSIEDDLLNIRGSHAGGLGTVLFGVANTGRVTIQGTTDLYSAFRVLGSTGDYLFNINSSNGYVFSNGITSHGNEVSNPSFETGGSIIGGEEGWFGTSQASIVNDSSNAVTGNYEMQILPNSTNIDIYAGNYHQVTPGMDMYFEAYVKNSADANGSAGIQVTWYNKDKGVISYSTDYGGLPGTTYAMRSVNATAPANAAYARVSATVRSSSNTGRFYFDDFYMKSSSEMAPYSFRNSEDGTTAFRIQAANTSTLFTANTSGNKIKIGDNVGNDTQITLLVVDHATADPTSNLTDANGGLFYRSDTNTLKAVLGGAVVDVCTTAVTCPGYSASASASVQLQGTTPGTAQTGNFNITGTGIMTQLQTQDLAANTSNLVIRTGNATGTGHNSGSLTIDVGTATGTTGSITIGHSGVATTMPGTLDIQGSNTLALGNSGTATGSILFRTAAGANTISIAAPGANPTSSWTLTLPQNHGVAGECLKDSTGTGAMEFSDCGSGITVDLQEAYDNSASPATITLADNKNLQFVAQDTTSDPNILVNLQCANNCGTNGRFAVQNGGTDVFTILPNGGGIILATNTQIGSATTDATQVNFQLDSYNGTADNGTCSTTINQGAMYYNTSMGSIRACINGSWSDVSNPDTLGLLTFGIVPSSGGSNNAYDLPSLIIPGASGPCRVSWSSAYSVSIQPCIAYSNGRRLNVPATTLYTNSGTAPDTLLTTTNRWAHVCLDPLTGDPKFTSAAGSALATDNMPTFNANTPILCLADVQGSATTAGVVDNLYDVRTFTTTLKEPVNTSAAVELGMLVDAGTNGALAPAVALSNKMYGLVVATDGATSGGAPNAIVASVGPAWVKANAGTAGQFVKTSTTAGYSNTTASIPNNSFYYSAGNTRTSWSTTCTAASNCNGSLYVNFIVR